MKYLLITIIYSFFFLFITAPFSNLFSSEFDELDKPPEGMHKDQLLILGAVSLGMPYGNLISAEEKFTKKSSYQLTPDTSKLIYLSHLAFGITISGEYMPADYIGIRSKLRRSIIIQNTNFGSDYKSWKKTLYSDYSIYLGPSFHITSRKPWDIALSPLIGISFSQYNPTPIAKELLDDYDSPPSEQFTSLTYGVDLLLSIFFSGGLVIQFGGEWIRNNITFSSTPNAENPQTHQIFYNKKSAVIDSLLFYVSAGYAFYN